MVAEKNRILDKKQVLQIVKRIAFQIYENNYKAKEIIIAGIFDKGYRFAELLAVELGQFKDVQVRSIRIELNKVAKTQPEVSLDVNLSELKGKTVILTDDVLNTGRAMIFSLQPFLSIPLAKLQTAVIVDRGHKLFPVSPDYVGYSLATTLKEHVEVCFDEKDFGVYLH